MAARVRLAATPISQIHASMPGQSTPSTPGTDQALEADTATQAAPDKVPRLVAGACGSWLASIASGGNPHNRKALSAPNHRRHGRRSAATQARDPVQASNSSPAGANHQADSAF